MRRTLASILAAVVSFPLIAPLLCADSDAQLPACCRRGGKHHCSMMAVGGGHTSPGPAFSAFQPKCPNYPAANTVSRKTGVALPGASQATFSLLFSRPALLLGTLDRGSVWRGGALLTRAPPAFS